MSFSDYGEMLARNKQAVYVPHLGAHTSEMSMQEQLLPSSIASSSNSSRQHIYFRRYRELYTLAVSMVDIQQAIVESNEVFEPHPDVVGYLLATFRVFSFPFESEREAIAAKLEYLAEH